MRARSTVRPIAVCTAAGLLFAGGWGAGIAPAGAAPGRPPTAAPTKTTTTITAGSAVAGSPTTITATVSPRPSGGTVSFSSDGTTLSGCGKAGVKSGKATCTATLTAGSHALAGKYSGVSGAYAASTGKKTVTVAAAPTFVGSLGSCTTATGALVAVDFTKWSGPVVRGCDPSPTTGIKLLTTAGFTTTGTQHDGPAFICRIGHPLFRNGTQYPTPSEDPCVRTPPASAYWSYWLALKGANTWTYSSLGAYSDKPKDGEVEAWTFGGTDVNGTNGQPTFSPNQVRAGLPAVSKSAQRAAAVSTARGRAAQAQAATKAQAGAGNQADLAAGVDYLVNAVDPNTGEPYLVDGHYYDPFGIGFGDFGLTMDGVFALAAVGSDAADTALARIVAFLDEGGKDASGRDVDDYTGIGTKYASGGSIGKEALVAEVTGYDPRDFGGHDLIAALDSLVCKKAIDNVCAGKGNYRYAQSTFSQALAVIAQLRAGDTRGARLPIAYLLGLQHDSGAFPSVLPGGDSETDSTAIAAMALAMVPGATARDALAKALSWLAGQQQRTGGFPGASGTSVNSTAVSIQALRLDAMTYAGKIAKAESFLAREQNADGGFTVALGAEDNGSDVRASTQAVGGVVGIPFGTLLDDLANKSDASDGADYLVGQLTDGDHYTTTFGNQTYDDQGLTADGVFALTAAGGHAGSVAAMVNYLEGQVDAYADPSGSFGGPFSGSLAKLALVAEVTGKDPHAFGTGNTDLLTLLRSKVCKRAIAGDFSPCTARGDFYNAFSGISQALGVLALEASPATADRLTLRSTPVQRLLSLQCTDGGFTTALRAAGDPCTSDVDMTGFAIQALAAVAGTDADLGAAQEYLQSVQRDSGLYPGTAGDNSNSTALAAQGLQTLVTALTSPTADPPGAKLIAPITTWQSALTGLHMLAVPGGGYGITGNATADVRASTQAVAAAAQRTLLMQSGATVRSLPREATTATVTTETVGFVADHPAGAADPADPAATPVALASTGAASGTQLTWALLLLAAGAGLLFAGRRRVIAVVGRHRAGGR